MLHEEQDLRRRSVGGRPRLQLAVGARRAGSGRSWGRRSPAAGVRSRGRRGNTRYGRARRESDWRRRSLRALEPSKGCPAPSSSGGAAPARDGRASEHRKARARSSDGREKGWEARLLVSAVPGRSSGARGEAREARLPRQGDAPASLGGGSACFGGAPACSGGASACLADAPPSPGRPAAVLRRRASLASPPGSESSRRASESSRRTSLDCRRLHRRWGPRRRATEPGVPASSTPWSRSSTCAFFEGRPRPVQ
jgi:hypothetical protein